jgi:hypothetical protein
MKRALRRHHERVAKARRIRILRSHGAWVPRQEWPYDRLGCSAWEPRIWRSMERLVMNEPGWWTHATVIQPARIETHRLEHRILHGCDADSLLWPDCKRPHDYYW